MQRSLLIGAASAALMAVSAPVAMAADNIALGQWYTGNFGLTGSPLVGGVLIFLGTSPAAVPAPPPAWTITLSAPAFLTVTDVEESGDQFTIFDNGAFLGNTSTPNPLAQNVGPCISCALSSANFSHGRFFLPAGAHSITGVFNGTITEGDFDFEVAVPEPATWSLMLIGVGGLGVALRSRRRTAAAAA